MFELFWFLCTHSKLHIIFKMFLSTDSKTLCEDLSDFLAWGMGEALA
jgi:hypothetical protein